MFASVGTVSKDGTGTSVLTGKQDDFVVPLDFVDVCSCGLD